MVGAAGFGYWVAHGAFWLLLAWTAVDSGARRVAIFAALWLAGYAASAWLAQGTMLFMSYVALLDVALVLTVFKGDIRLT